MYKYDLVNLYRNSFMHYIGRFEVYNNFACDTVIEYRYLLDKRFINWDKRDFIDGIIPYTVVYDLDDYYFLIKSPRMLNFVNIFNYLLQKNIIIDIITFSKVYEEG